MKKLSEGDKAILEELRGHLLNWSDWADPADGVLDTNGFSCIRSTMDAVTEGRVGLALTRWDDLFSRDKPELSEAAQRWRLTPG